MAKKSVLGKGLGALLAEANDIQANREVKSVREESPVSTTEIYLDQIEPNPYQPRVSFDEEALNELAESIKNIGIIQPLTLRRIANDRYQIISGERRFRAAKIAGLKVVPAYIRHADDNGMLEMAIVENIQRENLDAIETAMSFQRLIDECDLTQEEMADRVGKKRATVTNYLRLLKLPAEIQKAVKIGKISVGHAKVLLSVEDIDNQLTLCELIIRKDLSVRQLEETVKKVAKAPSVEDNPESYLPDNYYKVAEIVGKYFNNNVFIKRSNKGNGVMTVRFNTEEEVDNFLKAIQEKNL